jgi:hypothetical protein
MTQDEPKPTIEILNAGVQLLDRDLSDAYSFLGIQAERLEIAQSRLECGRAVPEWSDSDAYAKVLSDQRSSLDDLKRYVAKGEIFFKNNFKDVEPILKELLCKDGKVSPKIENLESDVKELLKYVSSGVVGMIAANLPAAIAGAGASIATVLAVIIIKNKIDKFCQYGVNAIENSNE